MNSLSLGPDETRPAGRASGKGPLRLALVLLLLCAGLGFVSYRQFRQTQALETQVAALAARAEQASAEARQATLRAEAAESAARNASDGRLAAQAQSFDATQQADAARLEKDAAVQDASAARATAAQAQAEADRIRKRAEAEVNRLEKALGQIAETRRTALGLVMNLGSNYLKFEFDKADLRPEDKELLSRIAGILLTSQDYTLSVNGHTDDVGSAEYNQKLSLRRAQAVRDYLVQAGLSPDILGVEGHGKSLPLVRASSDAARAKNRRVELGIVNTQIRVVR